MPLTKFNFKAGINKEETDYSNENGWVDGNLIRFRKNRAEKIGGWEKKSSNIFYDTARALHSWISLGANRYLGIGTTSKYYVDSGGNYNDVTPIRATTTNGITFAATNGSSVITATDSSHGALVGDWVTLAGAASLGGLVTADVLNQEYQIDHSRELGPILIILQPKILMEILLQLMAVIVAMVVLGWMVCIKLIQV